ncbi:hypothetical protein SLS64_009704 [Diaporthe eres]|uniref:Uncharacterized protein n=1 Tax=Diaporthe eres TaxID=83184 RepID=A0ABR1NZ99_DIAER
MASSLHLKIGVLCDNNGTVLDVKLATTLNEFLQPQSEVSIRDAAQSILTHLPADKPYSDEAFAFVDLIVEIAVQIPYQHPSHARLVRLLKYLTQSPKVVSRSTMEGEEELCINFQALGEQLRDNFQGPEAEQTPLEWVNYHAFLARLEAAGVWTAGLPSFAVWEMRDAFEAEQSAKGEDQDQLHQYHVMAAAQWILWNGQEIYKYMANPLPVSDVDEKTWWLGDCCTPSSMPVVSLARWQFWKEGFRAAGAERGDGSLECKDLAGRAAALMDVIEKSMSF